MTTVNKNIRFMNNNFAELTNGQIEFSSELSTFPQSNAQNKFRSKVWKPQGYFRVVETSTDSDGVAPNNTIYINDGSDKTVLVPAGNYTSADSLATAIENALNTSSSGWSVSYNDTAGTFKFKISHASSHTLRFSQTTDSMWNMLGFTSDTDEAISTERLADEQRNHLFEYVIFDFGYNHPINFCALVGELDQVFGMTDQATVKIQANNLNRWSSPPLDITVEPSVGGILRFLDDIADTSFRFWRIFFEDKLNPSGPNATSVGYIYLGDYVNIENRNINRGFQKEFVDPSKQTVSENGAIYFDEKTKYAKFSNMSLQYIEKNDRDVMEQLFFDLGTTTPFFISIDPTLDISNDLYDLTKYVIFDEQPKFRHIIRDLFSMSLSFREVL